MKPSASACRNLRQPGGDKPRAPGKGTVPGCPSAGAHAREKSRQGSARCSRGAGCRGTVTAAIALLLFELRPGCLGELSPARGREQSPRSAKGRNAKRAGWKLGQGKCSSLCPLSTLPQGTTLAEQADFVPRASWFCPQSARRAAQPGLRPPPSWGNQGAGRRGGSEGKAGDCFHRAQSRQPRTGFGSAQQGCSPGILSKPWGCIHPKGRAVRGCTSPRPGCPRVAALLFASPPLFLPFKLL